MTEILSNRSGPRKTLREMRRESGLTLKEIVARLRRLEPGAPRTHVGLLHIEERGTDRYPILKALAQIYGLPLEAVAAAARAS